MEWNAIMVFYNLAKIFSLVFKQSFLGSSRKSERPQKMTTFDKWAGKLSYSKICSIWILTKAVRCILVHKCMLQTIQSLRPKVCEIATSVHGFTNEIKQKLINVQQCACKRSDKESINIPQSVNRQFYLSNQHNTDFFFLTIL